MKKQNGKCTRREFLAKSTITAAGLAIGSNALTASEYRRIAGSNEKIRVGFIGLGNRGSQLMRLFMANPGCEVAALCDVYEPFMSRDRSLVAPRYINELGGQIPRMGEKFQNTVKKYPDFRRMLDDRDVDAVVISTPDHWHAIQTIQAIRAGKDVYVEKPLTITIREGRMMVEAESRSSQVVAVGLNRRGNSVYRKLAGEIPAGKIGKVTVAQAFRINNMSPDGIGKMRDEEPPAGLDWDMWLGPRANRPYRYNIAPYKFRWWSDYSSQMGNWGVHFMDVIRWLTGETAPVAISAHGGRKIINDDSDIPDTMQVIYEFKSGLIVNFCIYEASSGGLFQFGEIELRGTGGTLWANESGYRVSGARPGQFQTWSRQVEDEVYDSKSEPLPDGSSRDSTEALVRNFLECVKSRKAPLCSLEDGHRSTSFAHLANIAVKVKARLEWDPVKERFTNNEAANRLLHYEYRKPWKL